MSWAKPATQLFVLILMAMISSTASAVTLNEAEAARWFRLAADRGLAIAQYNLGKAYYTGSGVSEDHTEAVRWVRRAAEQGHVEVENYYLDLEAIAEAQTIEKDSVEEFMNEQQFIAKMGRSLCRNFTRNDFPRLRKLLRDASIHFMGRELRLEDAYRYLRCYQPEAENIDLLRVAAEDPIGANYSIKELVLYFVEEAKDKSLLGKIVMCKRQFGYGWLNVLEHIDKNLRTAKRRGRKYRTEALEDYRALLLRHLDEVHMIYDHEFCRASFLGE